MAGDFETTSGVLTTELVSTALGLAEISELCVVVTIAGEVA